MRLLTNIEYHWHHGTHIELSYTELSVLVPAGRTEPPYHVGRKILHPDPEKRKNTTLFNLINAHTPITAH